MDSVKIGEVRPFPNVQPDKAQALKPLEEAAEVFGAWQTWDDAREIGDDEDMGILNFILFELADVIQACANLAHSLGCDDLTWHLSIVERRNRLRGRYETPEECAESFKACFDEVEARYPNAMRMLEES